MEDLDDRMESEELLPADSGEPSEAKPKKSPGSASPGGSQVELYTDGGCSGNPGPGGWAFILKHPASGKTIERSGGERLTTNNRMELTAVVKGLETLTKPSQITLYTDSVYVGKGLMEWMPNWKKNGWRRKEKNKLVEIKNGDLWQQLDALVQSHKLKYIRVAGHSGHIENDRCDELAVAAYQQFLS